MKKKLKENKFIKLPSIFRIVVRMDSNKKLKVGITFIQINWVGNYFVNTIKD